MTDVEGSSASVTLKTEDAPAEPRVAAPTCETQSPDRKIATPHLEEQGKGLDIIKSNQENAGVDGDSEAETWIESPEKRKLNTVESASRFQPPDENGKESAGEDDTTGSQSSGSRSRKRKRFDDESKDESHQPSSRRSSPLSSPIPEAQSGNESASSPTHRNISHEKPPEPRRKDAVVKDLREGDGKHHAGKPSGVKPRRRRKSELEGNLTRPTRRKQSPEGTGSERRGTRSATYPRQESAERSLSPRPGRDHKRITSAQSVQTLASHKARRVPAPLNTRRNPSSDRSSDASDSPASNRPRLHKFASTDYDATSPAKVMAKKLRDRHGRTLLAQACTDNKLDRVKQVYDERPQDLNIADNAGNTPLQIAALQGYVEIVEFLLEKNCDVNSRNIERDTPLIDAVENGHIEVVKLLLDHSADSKIGNAKGEKPIELVNSEDEKIKRLLTDARNKDVIRRQSEEQGPSSQPRDGSSRAASAASPDGSPPVPGPKSPPLLQMSRRRAREQTRNDLLWQANTPENLTKLAGKGDREGVVNILNILNKASPEALIAACKGGHYDVLQLLIAMGNPDPDPDPVLSHDQKRGYNTPMLAAIGEGNVDNVKLLAQQDGFDPMREFRGRKYYEISQERKGDNWREEHRILKKAYDLYAEKHSKHSSPRKGKEAERRHARDSTSPFPRSIGSPSRSQTDPQANRDGRSNEHKRTALRDSNSGEHPSAVSSDHDKTSQSRSHKPRHSRSEIPGLHSEEEVRKRRRLISRREHMKSNSHGTEDISAEERGRSQQDKETIPVHRRRSSLAGETPYTLDIARVKKRSRRALSDSSPEETRSIKKRMSSHEHAERPVKEAKILRAVDNLFENSQQDRRQRPLTPESSAGHRTNRTSSLEAEKVLEEAKERKEMDRQKAIQDEREAAQRLEIQKEEERLKVEQETQQRIEEERQAAEHKQKADEEAAAKQKAREEAAAKQKADEEAAARQKAEEEAAAKHKAEEEAAAVRRKEEEAAAAARKKEEEAAAARKKEEEAAAAAARKKEEEAAAAARKKEEEERQERLRREAEEKQRREAEEKQRRAEERRLRFLREHEQRRMEALPNLLCKSAKLLDQNNLEAKSPDFLQKFLPLFTVTTRQIDPFCNSDTANEEWFPGFQAAPLLAAKNLGLEQYTHWEKRKVNDRERLCLWKVARTMLIQGDVHFDAFNMSIQQALQLDRETQPKFEAMQPLVWVKLSDFRERLQIHPYLQGLPMKTQRIGLHPPKPPQPQSPNGVYVGSGANVTTGVNGILPNGVGGVNGYHY